MAGQVVHVEFPADDTATARTFWGGLFGWQWQPTPGPFEYHMTQLGPQTGGGGHQHGARQAWAAGLL